MKRITRKIVAPILLLFSAIFAVLSTFALPAFTPAALAVDEFVPGTSEIIVEDPGETKTPSNDETSTSGEEASTSSGTSNNLCSAESGIMAWVVCPATDLLGSIVDGIYSLIGDFLVINPISMDDDSPIYTIWKYMRSFTNIIFVIFLLIVIYSQLTGLGLDNYGIKRILPRLIIAVLLVNLSYLICTLAIDVSNIIGGNLRSFFHEVQNNMLADSTAINEAANISLSSLVSVVLGGGTVAGIVISATTGFGGLFWMLLAVLIGAVISVVAGLITIASRQAVVVLLVMVAPLAFVAYLLPNTERWFTKWKDLFARMLVFYPMFSFLFGASQLAGWALIASASNPLGVIIGLGVQVLPLFASVSLMKMSGTFLSAVNDGIRRIATPVQRSATNWALEHAEQRRQNHIASSEVSGARLRRYLDYRRELRMNDTRNSQDIRRNRALERAYHHSAGITGRDDAGNTTWEKTPNRYTRNAKTANFYNTRATTAQAAYQNTLTGYGRHFTDRYSQRLSDQHGEAFLDAMSQQFLTTNEAQADQDWLLNKYLEARSDMKLKPYQYNRLVRDAAGGLGHTGETSIMGQVIVGNSNIENRRRTEGRIIINKFGMEKHKRELRGMAFDIDNINDDGFEIDENGSPIETSQYVLKDGKRHTPWQRYIAVHKTTGKEITKEQYDAMSDDARKEYKKVRYFDITDDHGNEVQRIFEDDAGYMKELLTDDINIADPINRRYINQIGVAQNDNEQDGILRRYHSTIRSAIDNSHFSQHAPGMTALLTSAANAGYLRNMTHYNIMNLQSLGVAMKPGSLLRGDKFFFEELTDYAQAALNEEKFQELFNEEFIDTAFNNNGIDLEGARQVIDPNTQQPMWEKVTSKELENMDQATALKYKQNFIKHKLMPRAFTSLIAAINRDMTPDTINSLKPGAAPALKTLIETLGAVGYKNLDERFAFDERVDGAQNIFETPDGKDFRNTVKAIQALINEEYDITSHVTPSKESFAQILSSERFSSLVNPLQRSYANTQRNDEINSLYSILPLIEEYCSNAKGNENLPGFSGTGLEVFKQDLASLFEETSGLREHLDQCQEILDKYYLTEVDDENHSKEIELIEHLRHEIETYIQSIISPS